MNQERSFARKVLDKISLGFSFISLPFETIGAVGSLISGGFLPAAALGGLAFLDLTQIREHGRPPEQQSWYNPERIMDKVIGSLRLNHTSRLAYSD